MAQQHRTFVSAARPKDWVTKDRAYTFTLKAYGIGTAGTQDVPSAATITIRKPGGEALATPVSAAAMTIDGSGNMTYALVSGNTATLGEGYKIDVAYTVSTVVYDGQTEFAVVRTPLQNVVLQADLAFHHSDVADFLTSAESNATSYIAQAFEDVCRFLDARGNRPYLVLNNEALRRAVEHHALELLFFSKRKSADDRYGEWSRDHATAYQSELTALGARLIYDYDQGGTIDGVSVEGKSGEEGQISTGYRIRH